MVPVDLVHDGRLMSIYRQETDKLPTIKIATVLDQAGKRVERFDVSVVHDQGSDLEQRDTSFVPSCDIDQSLLKLDYRKSDTVVKSTTINFDPGKILVSVKEDLGIIEIKSIQARWDNLAAEFAGKLALTLQNLIISHKPVKLAAQESILKGWSQIFPAEKSRKFATQLAAPPIAVI